jgi:hypothetical protein
MFGGNHENDSFLRIHLIEKPVVSDSVTPRLGRKISQLFDI